MINFWIKYLSTLRNQDQVDMRSTEAKYTQPDHWNHRGGFHDQTQFTLKGSNLTMMPRLTL